LTHSTIVVFGLVSWSPYRLTKMALMLSTSFSIQGRCRRERYTACDGCQL
jgi:hypothetical protein